MAATNPKKTKKKGLGRGLSALISSSPVPVTPPNATQSDAGGPQSNPNQQRSQTGTAGVPESRRVSSSKKESTNQQPAPTEHGATALSERVRYINVDSIHNNPKQPRQTFLQEEIRELADSIKTLGVLQPVMVRPAEDSPSTYEIIAGERRWRAAKLAKLKQLPAIIRKLSDQESLEIAIVENVQRSDLTPLEEARAYQRLMQEFSLSQREVAEKVGKDRASISNYIRLLKLPKEILVLLEQEKLSMGHAKAILTVKEPTAQLSLAKKVVAEQLSVRALEQIVSRVVVLETAKKKKPKRGAKGQAEPAFPEIVDRMRNSLGTKVNIHHHESGRGKIEIEYFSESELDRLIDSICA